MTATTQMRLTDSDKAKITAIRNWYALPSATAAVRLAIDLVNRLGPPGEEWVQRMENPKPNSKQT